MTLPTSPDGLYNGTTIKSMMDQMVEAGKRKGTKTFVENA